MTTPKSLRTPPARIFEDYTLIRSTTRDNGLIKVADASFVSIPDSPDVTSGSVGEGHVTTGVSGLTPIGFDFSFDGSTYNRFVACVSGWLALLPRSSTGFDYVDVLDGDEDDASGIKTAFSQSCVILAPWWDRQYTVANDLTQLALSPEKIAAVNCGMAPPPAGYNPSIYGVKRHNGNSPEGRRLAVRWNTAIRTTGEARWNVLKYEACIYENGKIEFRYVPRSHLTREREPDLFDLGNAAIGVYTSGTRFRDFSYGLGYRDDERVPYRLGGATYDPSYVDVSESDAYQTVNLKLKKHWPAMNALGALYTFLPPQNVRRVLPRAAVKDRDARSSFPVVTRIGDRRTGIERSLFDDRTTITYVSSSVISAPTMMPRLHGNSAYDAAQLNRQDLFAGSIEITSSIVPSSVDPYATTKQEIPYVPYAEQNIPGFVSTNDQYFQTGSLLEDVGSGFIQPLSAKSQIKLSLPVEFSTTMLTASSCMYYYNVKTRCWSFPTQSTVNGSDVWMPDRFYAALSNFEHVEDARGFDALGNLVASGSDPPGRTDAMFGSEFTYGVTATALRSYFRKTVTLNSDYTATNAETFTLPIDKPFLLEKAVISLPIEAGEAWFRDKTTCFNPMGTAAFASERMHFDLAGPALTVALFNQLQGGTYDSGPAYRRDLILTGTITHIEDATANLVFSKFEPVSGAWQLRQEGFNAFGGSPSTIVSATMGSYTGSVDVNCTAATSNGVTICLTRKFPEAAMATYYRDQIYAWLTGTVDLRAETLSSYRINPTNPDQKTHLGQFINPFCRSNHGYIESGRSIFGKEFNPPEMSSETTVPNPFYLGRYQNGSTVVPQQFEDALNAFVTGSINGAIQFTKHVKSPYVLFPGDRLVLSVSKTRPHKYRFYSISSVKYVPTSGTVENGSAWHDIKLSTGSINVTLYGSMLSDNREYHDTLNQHLVTDAVHESVFGNDPVLDQFDVEYNETHIGGYTDDYVTGSLVKIVNNPTIGGTIVQPSFTRGRAFSKILAREYPMPDITGDAATDNQSVAYRRQPWWERAGTTKFVQLTTSDERYWDSMMPSVDGIAKTDGNKIFVAIDYANPTTAVSFVRNGYVQSASVGWFLMNAVGGYSSLSTVSNDNWDRAFPFEPRYAHVARQQRIESGYVVDSYVTTPGGMSITVGSLATQKLVNSLYVGYARPDPDAVSFGKVVAFSDFLTYPAIGAGINTSSAGNDDVSKVLYGFGDHDVLQDRVDDLATPSGPSNLPTHRDSQLYTGAQLYGEYTIGPVIRGWKYGAYSGLASYSTSHWRRDHYGHMRDMLEQRPMTKFYITAIESMRGRRGGPTTSAVKVRFIDVSTGRSTRPENTWSQNLSHEATSSLPYFDGEIHNRADISVDALNQSVLLLGQDTFMNVTI